MLTPLRHLVRRNIERAGVGRQVDAAQLLALCQKHLGELVDPHVAGRTRAATFRHRLITLNVTSAIVAQELLPYLPDLTARMQREFPDLGIERIVTRVTTA